MDEWLIFSLKKEVCETLPCERGMFGRLIVRAVGWGSHLGLVSGFDVSAGKLVLDFQLKLEPSVKEANTNRRRQRGGEETMEG